jgi:hypothetical protein
MKGDYNMSMDKAITFGEYTETNKFTAVGASPQTYTLVGEHVISYVIWSPDGDFIFETDAAIDADSFQVPQNVLFSEGLKINTSIQVQNAGAGNIDIYFRGVR